jgi:hypothetical protein
MRGASICYFDPATGKEVQYEVSTAREHNPFGLGNQDLNSVAVRVSADGSVVTGWGAGGAMESNVIERNRRNHYWKLGAIDSLIPSGDSRKLFAHGQHLAPDLTGERERLPRPDAAWHIPAVRGNFCVAVQRAGGRPGPFDAQPASAEVLFATESKPLLKLGELLNFELPIAFDARGKTIDRNVVLIPDAKVLVVLPTKKRDQLVLYKADLDKALTNAGVDYLFVSSQPPTGAVKGESYSYTMLVRSKKGGVKAVLESGPKGMTVTPAGAVSWDVPRDFGPSEAVVKLKVTDASGREVSHSFTLTIALKAGGTGEKKGK